MRIRVVPLAVALLALSACAKTVVTDRAQLFHGKLPRPDEIFVYDFVATPADLPADSALADHPSVETQPQTPEEIALGRQLGKQIATELASQIVGMGLAAERGTPASQPKVGDLVIHGTLLSVVKGSAAERVVIGFGKGAADLQTAVEGFVVTEHGLRKLGGGDVESTDSKMPGGALGVVALVATHNPLGLVVGTGVKGYQEYTGAATIQGKAKDTAHEIATQLEPRFREQGWIP